MLSDHGEPSDLGAIWTDKPIAARGYLDSFECRRRTLSPFNKAYANHVSIALGSHGELATCIDLCDRLGFLKQAEATRLLASSNSVGRLLNGLYRSLEAKLLQESDNDSSPKSP